MSLQSRSIAPVPPQTYQVAQAAFPQGNRYMQLRDTLGTLYDDTLFAENLSDRQAADAVRAQIDWKYMLGLELTNAGPAVDSSTLCGSEAGRKNDKFYPLSLV